MYIIIYNCHDLQPEPFHCMCNMYAIIHVKTKTIILATMISNQIICIFYRIQMYPRIICFWKLTHYTMITDYTHSTWSRTLWAEYFDKLSIRAIFWSAVAETERQELVSSQYWLRHRYKRLKNGKSLETLQFLLLLIIYIDIY